VSLGRTADLIVARIRPAGRALDAAIMALRRGEPVLLSGESEVVLALAAESVNEDNLRCLRDVSARPLRVVLTRRRAVALALARREDLSGAVSISLAPELPAAVIRNLADPAASLGAAPAWARPRAGNRRGRRARRSGVGQARRVVAGRPCLATDCGRGGIGSPPRRFRAGRHRRCAEPAGRDDRAHPGCRARVPLAEAENARLIAFRPGDGGTEHLAILIGTPDPGRPGAGAPPFGVL